MKRKFLNSVIIFLTIHYVKLNASTDYQAVNILHNSFDDLIKKVTPIAL